MGFISNENGIARFAVKSQEELAVIVQPDGYLVNINNCDIWSLGPAREIHVQTVSDYTYEPSPHQNYLQQVFADLGLEQGYVVDIGAHNGRDRSNSYPLFFQGWRGLAVECDPFEFARLAQAYQVFPQVSIVRRKVTPDNLLPLFRAYEVPHQFDFLSLDIDSYDFHILARLLTEYRPSFISCEINEVLPPPLRFSIKPTACSDLSQRFYGQSLTLLDDLARKYDYAIIHMHYMDAFLIDRHYISGEPPSLTELFRTGLLEQPVPAYYQSYPFDVKALWQASPAEALEMVQQGYAPFTGQFELSLQPLF